MFLFTTVHKVSNCFIAVFNFADSVRENIGKLNLAYFVILVNKELFPVKVPHDKALSSENFGELNHADRLSADSAISSSE